MRFLSITILCSLAFFGCGKTVKERGALIDVSKPGDADLLRVEPPASSSVPPQGDDLKRKQCDEALGEWVDGQCLTDGSSTDEIKKKACEELGGQWIDGTCVRQDPSEDGDEEANKKQCEDLGGEWREGICVKNVDAKPGNKNPIFISTPKSSHGVAPVAGPMIILKSDLRDFQTTHPDFEKFQGPDGLQGLVHNTLGADGYPIFVGTPGIMITSRDTFAQWYRDVPGVNQHQIMNLTLTKVGSSNIYRYDNQKFFPIDNQMFGNEGAPHNYHFTLHASTTFTYRGGEEFHFVGDDDMWVFINNKLVVDLGGVHNALAGSVKLDTLGLTPGQDYPFSMFYAERHRVESHLLIETSMQLRSTNPYTYQAQAVDPEGAPVSYMLVTGPVGMSIDMATGLMSWPADNVVVGEHAISIKASDGAGGTVIQNFMLKVTSL